MIEGLTVIRYGRKRLVAKVVRDTPDAPWRIVHVQAFEDPLEDNRPRRVIDTRRVPRALLALYAAHLAGRRS